MIMENLATTPDNNLRGIEQRLRKLEEGAKPDKKASEAEIATDETAMGWRPQGVILGEWPDGTSRDTIVAACKIWIQSLPQHLKTALLEPFAPTSFRTHSEGASAAVQGARGGQLQQRLQEETRAAPSIWAAVERSLEIGQAKRWAKNA